MEARDGAGKAPPPACSGFTIDQSSLPFWHAHGALSAEQPATAGVTQQSLGHCDGKAPFLTRISLLPNAFEQTDRARSVDLAHEAKADLTKERSVLHGRPLSPALEECQHHHV